MKIVKWFNREKRCKYEIFRNWKTKFIKKFRHFIKLNVEYIKAKSRI